MVDWWTNRFVWSQSTPLEQRRLRPIVVEGSSSSRLPREILVAGVWADLVPTQAEQSAASAAAPTQAPVQTAIALQPIEIPSANLGTDPARDLDDHLAWVEDEREGRQGASRAASSVISPKLGVGDVGQPQYFALKVASRLFQNLL